jgi:hypothetical protein
MSTLSPAAREAGTTPSPAPIRSRAAGRASLDLRKDIADLPLRGE